MELVRTRFHSSIIFHSPDRAFLDRDAVSHRGSFSDPTHTYVMVRGPGFPNRRSCPLDIVDASVHPRLRNNSIREVYQNIAVNMQLTTLQTFVVVFRWYLVDY
jgi:hypothetical protein